MVIASILYSFLSRNESLKYNKETWYQNFFRWLVISVLGASQRQDKNL
jgi:putative colanic acid biosynthesis UDP-glucose lipid carrier transferase